MTQISIQFTQQLGDTSFDIAMQVPSRGITAIFGRSGAGKTSVINAVSGLTMPTTGQIVVNDRVLFNSEQRINVPVHQRRVGYVFQESRLFPHYTVKGNLLYGVKQPDQQHFEQIVRLLDIEKLLQRYPASLSGGEKQRVAIGRALLSKPEILLMDEPLASLDLPRKREVMPFLEELADQVSIPVLYVSHSLHEILRLANHLVILDQGRVVTNGSIEEVWASQAMRPWQSFAEQSSLFDAKVSQHHPKYALSKVALAEGVDVWVQKVDIEPNQQIRLQIRANDVSITKQKGQKTSIRNILPALVTEIESHLEDPKKQSVSVQLQLAQGCKLWATITPWALDDLSLAVGDCVYAQIKGVSVTQRDIAQRHDPAN